MINKEISYLKDKPLLTKGGAKLTSNQEMEKEITSLAKIVDGNRTDKTARLAKIAYLYKDQDASSSTSVSYYNEENLQDKGALKKKGNSEKILPKIVGDKRHYPPANKEWKNSIYAYNKNSLTSLAALDRVTNKTIKSYFNLTDNTKLARSYRMRNLIRRTTSKRVFVSKPEIKQTSNKVNITVYILNREGQFLLRKLYFYKKNMNINRDVYLHKLWLKKNLLAFKKTFKDKKSIRLLAKNKKLMTKRKNRNKTYIHNILINRYLSNDNQKVPADNRDDPLENKLFLDYNDIITINKKSQDIRKLKFKSLIKRNILKSLKKRNLIKLLKRRAKLVQSTATNLGVSFESSDLLSNKTFNNYLVEKKSTKIKFKLRNSSSIIKIRKRLSRFFFLKGRRRKKRFKKIRLPYSNLRLKKEIKFFSFKLVSELKYIRKLFLFRFIKYIFSLLKIKIYFSKNLKTYAKNSSKKQSTNSTVSLLSGSLNQEQIQEQTKNNYLFNCLNYEFTDKEASTFESLRSQTLSSKKNKKIITPKVSIFKNRYSYNKLKKIELLNLELLNFLKFIFSKPQFSKKLATVIGSPLEDKVAPSPLSFNINKFDKVLAPLYKKFEKKYFLRFLANFFKKEFLYINYFSKFLINKFKFGKYLPGLKYLINRIYSKKVKLNLVNIKYPQLNSDIYADTIASKLKKKLSLLRVLRSSLSLAKLPSEYLSYDRLADFNKLPSLTIHKSLNVNDLSQKTNYGVDSKLIEKDPLNLVLNRLYPYSFVTFAGTLAKDDSFDSIVKKEDPMKERANNLQKKSGIESNSALSKSLKILNIIRYKWVSGVRLEAAGRLTRRYTAARSVFKFRYKGSLKNIDYSQKEDISKRNASTVMLRNYVKSNSQYSFSKSKRRIGAFGLKAWVASY